MLRTSAAGLFSEAGKDARAITARKAVPPACPAKAYRSESTAIAIDVPSVAIAAVSHIPVME
jgi:hypothetical protein